MALETAVIVTGDDTIPAPAEVPTAPVRDDKGRFAPTTDGGTPPADATPDASTPLAAEPVADLTETPSPEPAAGEPATDQAPKKGSPQYRINQAIAKQRDAERKTQELQDRLAALEARANASPNRPPDPPTTPAPPSTAPDPDMPREDQYETWEEFTDAKVTYLAEKKAAERVEQHFASERDRLARAEAQRAETDLLAAHQDRLARGRQTHADFDEVINRDDIELSPPMIDAIVHSPVGEQVMYYLGQHPEVADRLKRLPMGPALVEMGEIQAQFRTSTPAAVPAASATARVPISSAPAPIRPVSAGTHAPLASLDDLPLKEFFRRRNEEEANRAKRW